MSGDLNGDDAEVVDLFGLSNEPARAENSYHVVTGDGTDETAVLDGFVIAGGHADGPRLSDDRFDRYRLRHGGGMYNYEGSPTLTNCTFSGNYGGGMDNRNNSNPSLTNCIFNENYSSGMSNICSSPTLTNCTFIENLAAGQGHIMGGGGTGGSGGGMYNGQNSNPILIDCTFSKNRATEYTLHDLTMLPGKGGGIFNYQSNPTMIDCNFTGNRAGEGGGMYNDRSDPDMSNCTFSGNYGGGMFNNISSPTLTNCAFIGNSTRNVMGVGIAGGIYNVGSSLNLTNCTFAQNSANSGNALVCGSDEKYPSNLEIINCIVWDGENAILKGDNSTIGITYSNIQGGSEGDGNIDADPQFADPGYWADVDDPSVVVEPNNPKAIWIDGDYHLKSQAGRRDPFSESWVKDDVTSPCIDAGDPESDWGDEVWPHGGRVNMGAYGGTREASMSVEPESMSLPRVAYVYYEAIEVAEGYQELLTAYGCPTTLIPRDQVATTVFDAYDLVIAGTDTGYSRVWADEQNVAAVEGSGKPVVGLGQGGYSYFGYLGLTIGRPNGGSGSGTAIEPVDPGHPLFREPYPIDIPEDGVLELCAETDQINIYLYPAAPDTVTTIGQDAGNRGYYTIALEQDRYLFWGFDVSADSLTETGRKLFVNVVIRTANAAWATPVN